MSTWHEVKKVDYIEVVDGEINIYLYSDYSGAVYATMTLEIMKKALGIK